MAKKKPDMTNLFAKTETPKQAGRDLVESRGVGLKQSEWASIDEIAQETDSRSYHDIAVYGLRYFLEAYKAGEIKLQAKQTKTLPGL